ncbi:MAG: hypothetical protein PUG16_00315 [Lachnospiraceae bacterium]|nr:hypothetical protein [Lachnospiraceae bacterium]
MNRKNGRPISKVRMQMLRRRRRKWILGLIIILILLLLLIRFALIRLSPKASVSTLTIHSDGSVRLEEVVDLKGTGVSESELKQGVRSSIYSFFKGHGFGSARVRRFSHVDGKVYVETRFRSIKLYQAYSGYSIYQGSAEAVSKKNYDFEDNFRQVSTKKTKKGSSAIKLDQILTSQTVLAKAKKQGDKVLVLQENIRVEVDGKIRYLTDRDTSLVSDNTVDISPENKNPDADVLTCIIYK